MGGSVLQVIQNIASMLTGTLGATLILIAVVYGALKMALTGRGDHIWMPIVGGILFFSAAWLITVLQGA